MRNDLSGSRSGGWSRRYAPLTGSFVAMLLAVFILPSALNIPQSNPSQTLEFAPVPPTDEDPPPPETGNVESLSLGTTSTAPAADAPGGVGPGPGPGLPGIPDGIGARPVTKRCVGNPPRQTADKLSPPCVAHFEGDNGGATYHGVTGDEITYVMIYDTRFCDQVGGAPSCCPGNTYVDLEAAPIDGECVAIRLMRALTRFFNVRYQTYGRTVHGWIWFNETVSTYDARSPEQVRAAAAANVAERDPFAGLNYQRGFGEDWTDAMAQAERVVISGLAASEADFYRRHPGRIWSYAPTLNQQAKLFASHVCEQIVPFPVSFSGNAADQGQPRVLGLLRAADPGKPQHTRYAELAKAGIEDCGGVIVDERTFPAAGRTDGQRGSENNALVAPANMSSFQQNDVTTVIWAQGYETAHTAAAASSAYYPEWVLAGDDQIEGNDTAGYQDQSAFDDHAWVVTGQPILPDYPDRDCWKAAYEGDPSLAREEVEYLCRRMTYYQDLRLLFTGIQVAGPTLTPETMDRGFHAIPPYQSDDPSVPACYFEPGDYTCVKDAALWHWDADAQLSTTETGCWLIAQGGQRFTDRTWPSADVQQMASSDDQCSVFTGGINR